MSFEGSSDMVYIVISDGNSHIVDVFGTYLGATPQRGRISFANAFLQKHHTFDGGDRKLVSLGRCASQIALS